MAAFNVKTQPNSLSLKPGGTGTIMVAVSNLAGQPVMGVVQGILTPASTARWLVSPPDLQRRYEADPVATVNYEFKVAVPEDAQSQTATFKAAAWNALTPDDTRAESQPVTISVTREPIPDKPKKGIPWWIWVIVGVVVVGAGIGIWLLLRPKGVPDVVGKPVPEATDILRGKGFKTIVVLDTLDVQGKDTAVVLRQAPEAGSDMPKEPDSATIVVHRTGTAVPPVVGQKYSTAFTQLQNAGLVVGKLSSRLTNSLELDDKVYSTTPTGGTRVRRGSIVDVVIHSYSPNKFCPPYCVLQPAEPQWKIESLEPF